ncbi:MAG: flagellar basal-body MS-ring/collar protein FliF [Deltaproteobacteria bacterium]|nr:flagellar basal-body MS-ring/collar protein FliF [Deltaproteobacteria bacterium]
MTNKVLENFKKLGAGRTTVMLGGAALAVAFGLVFLIFNKAPEYQVLYSQLSSEDSGAVIEKLKEKRIPYTVDGMAISVPAEKVYETRMELAGAGLPQGGGVGFEIFDKTGFGVTDFVQKVNYKRALQGELARTISQIKEIESARIHLALPEKGVFLDEQKKSRASIIVKLKPGKSLSQGQVSSIVHLVANSSENLRPEDITVVDTSGRMWTKESDGDPALRLTATQLEYKRSLEKDIESRVQTMLEKAVGAGKVVARVSAEVDTKQVERTEETYNPDGQVIRSEHRNKENTVGGTLALGVPGVLSNMPEGNQNPPANSTPAQTHRQDEVINYEISKAVTHVIEPVGGIKRLTIAVLIDGSYETVKGADGKETRKYNARSEDDIAKYAEMVKGAVGFSDKRGDAITVVSTPFERDFTEAAVEAEVEPIIPAYLMPSLIRYGSAALIAIFAIIFVLRPVIKRLTQESAALEAIQKTLPHGLQKGLLHGHEPLEPGTEDSLERIKMLVKENPQQVAFVLKGWMKER